MVLRCNTSGCGVEPCVTPRFRPRQADTDVLAILGKKSDGVATRGLPVPPWSAASAGEHRSMSLRSGTAEQISGALIYHGGR